MTPAQAAWVANLAQGAVDVSVLMIDRATITAPGALTAGTFGARQGAATTVATDVPCHWRAMSGRESSDAARTNSEATSVVEFAGEYPVGLAQQIQVEGRGLFNVVEVMRDPLLTRAMVKAVAS